MGASPKIQDTNLNILKFQCSQCQQPFANKDKENDNWDLWWDTSNEVKIDEIWPNNKGFTLSIWVRDITHKLTTSQTYDCPEKEVSRA